MSDMKVKEKPNLSVLALVSFIASFGIARVFTTLSPNTVLIGGDYHIHHFWYGLALLATGGWLGISYESERINRLAAILFGAGGGLIGDEIGLLLTFEEYWTAITYTAVIVILAFSSITILLFRYSEIVLREFSQFLHSSSSLYVGVFLAVVSAAFLLETKDIMLILVLSFSTAISCVIIIASLIQRLVMKRRRKSV